MMMQTLQRLADEVQGLRVDLRVVRQENKEASLQIAKLHTIVARLESAQQAQTERCVLRHNAIDVRLDGLDEFKADTGIHEISNLKSQLAKRNDWVTWITRTIAGALIATSLAGGGYFARGCSPQGQMVVK